jgi:site-specific DNA-adenine methylase
MRYGLPYKGSKNAIAEWVVDNLPRAETFVDLFCGGGAITHRAMLTGKYKKFIMNDIDGRLPKLFKECALGKHTIENHQEWISREEFQRRKSDDAYIALVWSFGNNGVDYIYGAEIEPFKHDYHRAVFENKPELLKKWGYDIKSKDIKDIYDRYLLFNAQIKKTARSDLDSITRQIEIERLQSLQSLQSLQRLQRLQSLQSDYSEIDIPQDALIYCDIPYKDTNCGKYGDFDHERFYKWAEQQDNIYISEYDMPSSFIKIAEIEKTVLSASNDNSQKAIEKIFTNERTFEQLNDEQKQIYLSQTAKQLTFWEV